MEYNYFCISFRIALGFHCKFSLWCPALICNAALLWCLPPPNFAIAALRDPEFVMAYGSEVLFAHNSCRTTAQGPSMIPVCLMCHAVPSEFCEDTLTVPLQE